jgi:hypothetical protein
VKMNMFLTSFDHNQWSNPPRTLPHENTTVRWCETSHGHCRTKQPSETGSRRRRLNIEIVQVILRATWKTESDEENRIISMDSW